MDTKGYRRSLYGTHRDISCAGKKAFPSRRLAKPGLVAVRRKENEPFHVYLCRCGMYHIGHVLRFDP